MEIISADFKKGIAHLRITDPEDLWYLRQLIDPGDLITGKTTRKIKVGEAETKSIKKTYTLKIEAENTELSPAGQNLRINGRIKESPEELPLNSYQSITLELASEFTLEKINWMEYQKQKLKEATEKKYSYLLCVFDREEALLALTKKFGYEVLAKTQGEVQKKAKIQEIKKDFYEEIIKAIGRGFNPEIALLLLNEDICFELIDLKNIIGKSKAKLSRIKSRLIGTQGKCRKLIEKICKVHICIYGRTVGVIGKIENVHIARAAIRDILKGAPHGPVYRTIEERTSEFHE